MVLMSIDGNANVLDTMPTVLFASGREDCQRSPSKNSRSSSHGNLGTVSIRQFALVLYRELSEGSPVVLSLQENLIVPLEPVAVAMA